MNRIFLMILVIFFSRQLFSQIEIHQDSRIDKAFPQKQNKEVIGFRVQIGFDADKSAIESIRNRFISANPKIDTYMSFDAPYFNLKVGDFRTEIEAQKFAEKIQGEFSLNIVHRELINIPRID